MAVREPWQGTNYVYLFVIESYIHLVVIIESRHRAMNEHKIGIIWLKKIISYVLQKRVWGIWDIIVLEMNDGY